MPVISAAFSAFLLAMALPNEVANYGTPFIGFFCLAPYFLAIGKTRSKKEAAFVGAVFGGLSHAFTSYWLYFFKDFAIWTIGSTSVAYAVLQALVAPFLRELSTYRRQASLACDSKHLDTPNVMRPFLLAAAWAVWEWQKSIGFLGYPWGLVAYAVNNVPALTQIADTTGVYGLSFLLALASATVAEGVRAFAYLPMDFFASRGLKRRVPGVQRHLLVPVMKAAAFVTILGLTIGAYGWFRLARPTPTVDTVPMVLVQHNGDSWITGGELRTLKTCIKLTRDGIRKLREGSAVNANGTAHEKPALIVWSETALSRPFEDYRPYFRKNPQESPLIPFLAEAESPLLTGAPIVLDWNTYDATNSAILIESDASVPYTYAKRHPVPFAEAIPFWEYAWMRNFMMKVVGLEGGWTMGTEATVMKIPTPSGRPLRFGVPICFEDAFADVCADFFRGGADMLINITNDTWSKTISAETQHFVASRFRAIENRRVLVRSTNGGLTCVVDAEGQITASLPLFTEDSLAVIVPIQKSSAPTLYSLLGDWLPKVFAIILLIIFVVAAMKRYAEARQSRYPN